MSFFLWALAVMGATLILTNGSIFAWLREGLPEGKVRTLVSCPMCSGFWFGILASLTLGSPTSSYGLRLYSPFVAVFADGCVASVLASFAVALWIATTKAGNAASEIEAFAVEGKLAANLWRYLRSVPTAETTAEASKTSKKEPPDAPGDPSA